MKQLNAPKPPAWRDPVRLQQEAKNRRLRPIAIVLSLVVGVFLALPPSGNYNEAISFQLSRGEPLAWALFMTMGGTMGYVTVRLWRWESRTWSIATGLIVVGLAVIGVTDPFSDLHNTAFIAMSGSIVLGHIGLFYGHLDWRLLPSMLLAVVAAFLCVTNLGLGERLLIAATLATLNVIVYGHLDV